MRKNVYTTILICKICFGVNILPLGSFFFFLQSHRGDIVILRRVHGSGEQKTFTPEGFVSGKPNAGGLSLIYTVVLHYGVTAWLWT